MIDDVIAEVCTELTLLSDFASHIEHAQTATLDRDVIGLLSGLSSLAAHAQKVRGAGAGQVRVVLDDSTSLSRHSRSREEPQHRVPHRTESVPDSPHKWVLEVLEDLKIYTRTNDLQRLANSLESICNWHRDQLLECEPVDPAIDCVGTDNVVLFTLDRRSKVSGECTS